jgi:vacuolar-type H+-ATPase subunit H
MMSPLIEKLKIVKEAEDKARQTLEMYRQMAEEAISQARKEIPGMLEREEATARVEGERILQETILHAHAEAEELRVEYTIDRAKLLSAVAVRNRNAVTFLFNKFESGE